jgi:hypothetical protein
LLRRPRAAPPFGISVPEPALRAALALETPRSARICECANSCEACEIRVCWEQLWSRNVRATRSRVASGWCGRAHAFICVAARRSPHLLRQSLTKMAESPASMDVAELAIDGSLDGFGRARPAFWGVQSQAFTGRNVATFAALQRISHSRAGMLAWC